MNSYLGHLVQRSLDRDNRVRPRVPSLFEPVSEGASTAAMAAMTDSPQTDSGLELTQPIPRLPGESSPIHEDQAPSRPLRPLPSTPRSDSQVLQRSMLDPTPRVDEGEMTTSSSQVPEQVPTPASPSLQPIAAQNASPSATPELPVRPTLGQSPSRMDAQGNGQPVTFLKMPSNPAQPAVPASLPPQPTLIERQIETITPAIPAAIPAISPSIKTIGNTENSSSSGAIERPVPFPNPAPASAENAANLRPAITASPPPLELSATKPISSPVPPPTPTIQVTIGRIEVRATTSAPKPRKSRPAPPAMSLNDYLQQRGGGK